MGQLTRRIIILVALIGAMIVLGAIGYSVIEGWSLLASFYMAVITIGSVGYGEVEPLSAAGRVFTIFYIIAGVGTLAASFTILAESFLSAELRGELRRQRMQRQVDKLKDHIIVCGYGRVGRNAVQVLRKDNDSKRPIVIIEKDDDNISSIEEDGMWLVEGDATYDETLRRAGVERAWGLLVALGSDANNLFIVVSARNLNPNLTIVVRSSTPENDAKMLHAGASRVVSPYRIGGQRMANSLLRPQLTEFLDVLTTDGGVELWLEEIAITDDSPLRNRSVLEMDMRRHTGVTLLAILRRNLNEVITPEPDTRLLVGDELIVIGTRQQLAKLEKLVA